MKRNRFEVNRILGELLASHNWDYLDNPNDVGTTIRAWVGGEDIKLLIKDLEFNVVEILKVVPSEILGRV